MTAKIWVPEDPRLSGSASEAKCVDKNSDVDDRSDDEGSVNWKTRFTFRPMRLTSNINSNASNTSEHC